MLQQNESDLKDPITKCLSKIYAAGLQARTQVDYRGFIIGIHIIDNIMICGLFPINPKDHETFTDDIIERAKKEQETFKGLDNEGRKTRKDKINEFYLEDKIK